MPKLFTGEINMSNSYYESPHTPDKASNVASWSAATGLGMLFLLAAVVHPSNQRAHATPQPVYVEVKTDQHPLAKQAWDLCSSGKARFGGTVSVTNVNAKPAQLKCYEGFWIFRGQKMPTDRPKGL